MSTLEIPKGKNEAQEIIETMVSWKANTRDGSAKVENVVSLKVEKYIKTLLVDVNKSWYSKSSSPKFIAESLVTETSELLGEFNKEQRTEKDRTKTIAPELADSLYYLVKFIDKDKEHIKESWFDILLRVRYQNLDVYYDNRTPKELSESLFNKATGVYYKIEPNGHYRGSIGEAGDAIADMFLILLKIAEKRGINLDEAWKEKMKENNERKANSN